MNSVDCTSAAPNVRFGSKAATSVKSVCGSFPPEAHQEISPVVSSGAEQSRSAPNTSHVNLLSNRKSVIYLDAKIANGALDLSVPKQQLYRSQIAGTTIDEGSLGPPE